MSIEEKTARFAVGELVHHQLFDYRGVVVDVDSEFNGTEEWYENVARSRPPKDQPWYHVLVDKSDRQTYVAQRHLDREVRPRPVEHPLVDLFFESFRDGCYITRTRLN